MPPYATAATRPHISVKGGKKPDLAGAQVFLTADGRRGHTARVDKDQIFMLRNLPPDRYNVQYGGFGQEFYLESIRSEGTDVLNDDLAVLQNGTVSLEVLLGSDGGRRNFR